MIYYTLIPVVLIFAGFCFFLSGLYRAWRSKPEVPVALPSSLQIVPANKALVPVDGTSDEVKEDLVADVSLPPEWFHPPAANEEEEAPKVRPALIARTERVAQFQIRSEFRAARG